MRRVLLAVGALALVGASNAPLTVGELLAAYRAGAPAAGLLRLVNEAPLVAAVSPAELAALQAAGVPEEVIRAVLARAPLATPTPEPRPDDPRLVDLARLAHAGLSESLLEAYVGRLGPPLRPTANDLLYLQANGVPHGIIASLLAAPSGTSPPTPVPTAVPPPLPLRVAAASAAAPGTPVSATPSPAPSAAPPTVIGDEPRFEPLLRELGAFGGNPVGAVTLTGDGVVWSEKGRPRRGLALPAADLAAVRLRCTARGGEGSCFELRLATRAGEELALRDVNWETGGNTLILALSHALRERFPGIAFETESAR